MSVNNSSTKSVTGELEHLFKAGGEGCSLLYPLGRAHATLPRAKFTVWELGSSGVDTETHRPLRIACRGSLMPL